MYYLYWLYYKITCLRSYIYTLYYSKKLINKHCYYSIVENISIFVFLVDEIKKKWRSIRDSYRKKCVTKSGQAVSKVKKYIYADILEFLRPVMVNRK